MVEPGHMSVMPLITLKNSRIDSQGVQVCTQVCIVMLVDIAANNVPDQKKFCCVEFIFRREKCVSLAPYATD